MSSATPQTPVKIALSGALGRMGLALARTMEGRSDVALAARFDRPGATGEGLVAREEALRVADVVIDFTTPAASTDLAKAVAAMGAPALVIGSTGLTGADEAVLADAARKIPIVYSGNYSLGVNILTGLVAKVAAELGPEDWDVEISEGHHRRKVDSPSGTALMLGRAAAAGRGQEFETVRRLSREGINGARPEGEIGFSALRAGGIIGEHSVVFASEEEILTLSHSARDRALFARGALKAAVWVSGRTPGLYDMQQVLGFAPAE